MQSNDVWNLLSELSNKKGISEIVINRPDVVFVEREGQFIQLNVELSRDDIDDFILEVANLNQKECSYENPILDGSLPDGSRINIVVEPYSYSSPSISIRKYSKSFLNFNSTDEIFGLNDRWKDFFKSLVSSKMNIVISGGTSSGKTTFLNLLLTELSLTERVVTIEDTLEIRLDRPNVVRLESGVRLGSSANISVRDLVKNTLRMRPDRIIIGEVRGGELFDLLQAMNTGHEGSMTTIHSNSPGECFQRIETLFMMAGFDVPVPVIRRQLTSAVDFIIQLSRTRDGKRAVTEIREVTGMEGSTITSQVIGSLEDGVLRPTGLSPQRMERLHRVGGLPLDFFNF